MKKIHQKQDQYKVFERHGQLVFALNSEITIPQNAPVRLLSAQLEELEYGKLYKAYSPKGRKSAADPRVLFKVMVHGYLCGIYPSRKLEEACQYRIDFRWLLEDQKAPDHTTFARFRTGRCREVVEDLFYQFVKKLEDMGETDHQTVYIDGTKLESAAGRYTFVWRKPIQKHLAKVKAELEKRTGLKSASAIASKLEEERRHILFVHGSGKRKSEQQREWEEQWTLLERWKAYERKLAIMGEGRNSYSKTDPDATFMRMKEDHMLNGQLKPGYNIQVGTENNFVIGYDVFPNPTDTRTFIPHLENVQKRLGCKFKFAIADAGYGSEENYDYLEENEIKGIVKYTTYEKETKRSFKKKTFNTENWKYDAEQKEYTCPCGNPVPYRKTVTKKNKSGYLQTYEVYQCENCEGCPFRELCTKSEYGRVIQRNGHWLEQKAKVKELLSSEEYKTLMKKRSTECETVFGQTKGNLKFRRFHLRGKEKVGIEWGLLMLGYDFKQLIRLMNT